jgi:hypothetical protein
MFLRGQSKGAASVYLSLNHSKKRCYHKVVETGDTNCCGSNIGDFPQVVRTPDVLRAVRDTGY